jgi:hypothetical protein
MLSDASVALIRDVFGAPDLLRDLPRILKRIVCWGAGKEAIALDHSGVVVSEQVLVSALGETASRGEGEWAVLASPPLPPDVSEQRFGSRMACAAAVELRAEAEPAACWVESLPAGWLFLITDAPGAGWLLAVGGVPEEMLSESRLIAPQVFRCEPGARQFPASPRMATPVCGAGWLACGTAAMAFDPLCGDGTAHAVREAVLASAVIRAVLRGGDVESLLAHYEARLTAGFRRHLELCIQYYRTGFGDLWWRSEELATRRGLEWCHARLRGASNFQYRLNGFDLERVE